MGRPPCCDKVGVKKGPWTPEEDIILVSYIQEHGPGNWRSIPINTGLLRCSKSCRLRWTNYLRPGIKRGSFTPQEEGMIVRFQALLGNKWAAIASYLPQRTDNDIKNYWNTHLKKKLKRFQSTTESSMAQHHQDSSSTTRSTKFLSKSTSTSSFHERRGVDHFTTSSINGSNNQTSSSPAYASGTDNISRLLEGWMRSSTKPTTNTITTTSNSDHPKSNTPKSEELDQFMDHGGGELMSHEKFESILSFKNCDSNADAYTTKGSQLDFASEEKDNNLEVSDQKKHKSELNTTPSSLSFLEKWLLDEHSAAQVGEALELSSIF